MLRRSLASLVVAIATGLLSTSTALPQPEPYVINAIFSLTGPLAFLGNQEASALNLAQDVINRSGGIKGRPVRFVVQDDTSSPQTDVQLMSTLAARGVPIVLGPIFVAGCDAVLPIVERAGPLSYCLSPLIQPPAGSLVVGVGVSPKDSQAILARFVRSRGWTRVGIITTIDATGQVMERELDNVLEASEQRDLHIVAREHYANADISVAAQVSRVKAQDPQVIFSYSAGAPFGTLLHGLHDGGLDVPVIAAGGNMVRDQLDSYATFLPKDVFFCTVGGVAPNPYASAKVRAAERVYFDAFHAAKLYPGVTPMLAWDAAMVVVNALRAIGTNSTPQQTRDYLEQLRDFGGVAGLYDFRHYTHRGLGPDADIVYRWEPAKHDFTVVPFAK